MIRTLRVTFTDGTTAISTFERLGNLAHYVRRVFAGAEPFPVWIVTSETHPQTNEPTTMRYRSFVPIARIAAIEEVDAQGNAITLASPAERGTYRIKSSGLVTDALVRVNADLRAGLTLPRHFYTPLNIEYVIAYAHETETTARYVDVRTGNTYDGAWTLLARGDGRDLGAIDIGTELEDGEDGEDGLPEEGDDDEE